MQSEVRSYEEHTATLQQQNELLIDALQIFLGEDNYASGILELPSKHHWLQQALAGPITMTTVGATYSPTAVAILIPATATSALGM